MHIISLPLCINGHFTELIGLPIYNAIYIIYYVASLNLIYIADNGKIMVNL